METWRHNSSSEMSKRGLCTIPFHSKSLTFDDPCLTRSNNGNQCRYQVMAKQNNPEQLNHNDVHDAVPAFPEEDIAKLVHDLDKC